MTAKNKKFSLHMQACDRHIIAGILTIAYLELCEQL